MLRGHLDCIHQVKEKKNGGGPFDSGGLGIGSTQARTTQIFVYLIKPKPKWKSNKLHPICIPYASAIQVKLALFRMGNPN